MIRKAGVAFVFWSIAFAALLPIGSVTAQDNAVPPSAAEKKPDGPDVLTGTRLPRLSTVTAAPLTVWDREDLLAWGKMSIGDILQYLPAHANALNTQFNSGGNGKTAIGLRSLQPGRTLVLLNGRRHVPGGDGADVSVDLNAIPLSIVERVEVLRDGASAIYGSDAIAGVVNIVTRRRLEGVEANAYSSLSERGDARILQLDITTGISSDKGHAVFSATFFDQQPVFAGERDFSRNPRFFNYDTGQIEMGTGSRATPQGTIIDRTGGPGNALWRMTGCAADVLPSATCFNDPVTGWRPFGSDEYNFRPQRFLVTPSRRINLFVNGHYEVNDYLGLFFEAGFNNRASSQRLDATPLFTLFEGIFVSGQNRFNPFARDFTFVGRRVVEAGNRIFTQDSNTFRVVVGGKGAIPDIGPLRDWHWEAYINVGRTETINTGVGWLDRQKLARSLGPDSECTGDCVPLDLFNGVGSITPQMLDYISFTGVDRGFTEQNIAAANLVGPLFELSPGHPVALALGYQFRKEVGADIPNPLAVSGDSTGATRQPVEGEFMVHAGHGELSVPLVAGVRGATLLEVNAAGRFVHFDTFGSTFAYKLGLRWKPFKYGALRAAYSASFRAPSIFEMFSDISNTVAGASDPCSSLVGQLDNPRVAATCAADGLPSGVPDPQVQLQAQAGGNPDLDPETATVITAGAVLDDGLIPGLTASIDYYNIEIDHVIQSIDPALILQRCYAAQDRQFCELVQRNSAGFITNIRALLNNVGGFKAEGVDFNLGYSTASSLGRVGAGLEGTVLIDLTEIQPNGFEQSFVGNFDQATGANRGANPSYRLNAYMRWAWEFLNAGANFRFIPGFKECDGGPCERPPGSTPPLERNVDAYYYMDIFAGVQADWALGHSSLTIGINNLTDASPPFVAAGAQSESDAATYDFVGRQYYFRLTQKF